MKRTFMPRVRTEKGLRDLQLAGLQWTVNHVYRNSPFYRKRFAQAGVTPEHIRSLADLEKLPLTTADDLREGYPFPLLSSPIEEIVRIHASSGTTGKRKVLCYTQKDIDDWSHMFARCYEMAGLTRADRVQIAVGYGVWTAGVGFQLGCERFGALAIPAGPGNIELQCQFLADFQSTVFCATASMAFLMAEEVHKRGLRDKIALKKIIMGSERSSDSQRRRMRELLGVEEVFDIPGLTELYGPGTGLDCVYHQGVHYWADYYLLEILDPDSLQPVPPGETGEMVVTTLRKEGAPLIRYRTRDLTRLITGPCPCGSILPRHDRLLGRSDDLIIFRAVNIYPGQIDHILSLWPQVGSEYQLHLECREDGRDYMTVIVERAEGVNSSEDERSVLGLKEELKKHLLVSNEVKIVDQGALPRSERKSKRVFDDRGKAEGF